MSIKKTKLNDLFIDLFKYLLNKSIKNKLIKKLRNKSIDEKMTTKYTFTSHKEGCFLFILLDYYLTLLTKFFRLINN